MPYNVRYSDVAKGIIVVEDETINDETSLLLSGKRSIGYGQYVAENFLHLLENFANTTPPPKPIEGQLWYDTTETDEQLKVYDGTGWVSAGGLKKGSRQPSINNSNRGDLWSNTDTQQLYIFTGAEWILVGPTFSGGLLTGSKAEIVLSSNNIEYSILTIKIQDRTIAVISDYTFTPKVTIPGFSSIKSGININTNLSSSSDAIKYWGIAEKAEALQVTNDPTGGTAVVSANSFLRKDIDAGKQNINVPIEIRDNAGLTVGESSQLALFVSGNGGVLQNNITGSSISIRMRDGTENRIVLFVDSAQKIGINNTAPEEDLDIKGNLQIRPKDNSTAEGKLIVNNTSAESITTLGGIEASKGLSLGDDLTIAGDIIHTGNIIGPENIGDINNSLDIGSSSNKYNSVWASTFNGNLNGNVVGVLSGNATTATSLSAATSFSIIGDVSSNTISFNGTGGTANFVTSISDSFIGNKDEVEDTVDTDEILINRVEGETLSLFKTTKQNLLKDIPVTPVGTIVPYGGDFAPPGWELCNGTEIEKTNFNDLWEVIGHKFKDPNSLVNSSLTHFALPDFRGRMPVGVDNMGGTSANVVTDIEAERVGGIGGSESKQIAVKNLPDHKHNLQGESEQYYTAKLGDSNFESDAVALGLDAGVADNDVHGYPNTGGVETPETLGQNFNVMNPFLAMNFIIYTGVI